MLSTVIVLLVVYQLKHFLADYPLQGPYMLKKFLGGWDWVKPLAAHAGVHAVFTFVVAGVYLAIQNPGIYIILPALGLAAFDFTVHFCMDRLKASPNLLGRFKALSPKEFMACAKAIKENTRVYITVESDNSSGEKETIDKEKALNKIVSNTYFWWSLGLDQMVHHLTHYVIIRLLVT